MSTDFLYQNIIAFCSKVVQQQSQNNFFNSLNTKTQSPTFQISLKDIHISDLKLESLESFEFDQSALSCGTVSESAESSPEKFVWDDERDSLLKNLKISYKRHWRRIHQRFCKIVAEPNLPLEVLKERDSYLKANQKNSKQKIDSNENEEGSTDITDEEEIENVNSENKNKEAIQNRYKGILRSKKRCLNNI